MVVIQTNQTAHISYWVGLKIHKHHFIQAQVGPPVEVSGTGGCGHPHVNNFYLSVVQVADDMAGGRGLALTSTRYDYYRGGIGGGGYIF